MNKKGFTLMELTIVMLIVSILTAVALPNYRKAIQKSRSVEANIMSKSILEGAAMYAVAYRKCPTDLTQLDVKVSGITVDTAVAEGKDWRFVLKYLGAQEDRVCCVVVITKDQPVSFEVTRVYVGKSGVSDVPSDVTTGQTYWRVEGGDSKAISDFFQAIQVTKKISSDGKEYYQ